MILVTGATGKVGAELVAELQARQAAFRVMVRKPEDAQALAARGVSVVRGDFEDAASLRKAMEGAGRLFLLTPPAPEQLRWWASALGVARAEGVQHVVKLSALGAAQDSACPFLRDHALGEAQIESAGFAFTHLRPANFAQNLVHLNGAAIRERGELYSPARDARIAFVDTRDVAAVAAHALTEDVHAGRVYELTGPQAFSHPEVAERLSLVLGRGVSFVAVSDVQAYEALAGAGIGPWLAYALVTLGHELRRGIAAQVTHTVELVTRKPARALDAFLLENKPAFGG